MGNLKDNDNGDLEFKEDNLPYPKAVYFIIINEFCERFSLYGLQTVLILYLTTVLNFSDSTATTIFHIFAMSCCFTPIFGAVLADSFLGKFKTIFYLSIVYAIGNIVLAMGATPPFTGDGTDLAIPITILGLALIALGTGGIKPCVAAFGADQFILPQQAAQAATFFSFFYMTVSAGSLISAFMTPIIRSEVQCYGDDSCYSLAFAIPAGLMIASIVLFLAGKSLYRETKQDGNVVLKVLKCIRHAISRKRNSKTDRGHWLDHADDTYEQRFIEDIKIVLRVLVLYIPLPVFSALFAQQGSRWTLQATRMNGAVCSYIIKPDQIQVINSILVFAYIPLFDNVIYPLLSKFGLLKKPLQRLTTGGALAGIAFIISGVVELQLEVTSLHILWQIPQYIVLTAAELMFSITGIEFSYSQAPASMKSVVLSAWLMTVAFGNLIVAIIAESKFFQEQYKEFFLFAGLMFLDVILFGIMAHQYIPAKLEV